MVVARSHFGRMERRSNRSRTTVESKSNHSCNRRITT